MPSPEVSPTVGGAKFANTILRVYLPPQEDSFPLRLRTCMTISFSSNTLLEHLIFMIRLRRLPLSESHLKASRLAQKFAVDMILQSSNTYLDPTSLAISLPSLETNSISLFEFVSRFLV